MIRIILFLQIFLMSADAFCAQVTLGWNVITGSNIAGYRIFCREENKTYNFSRPLWTGSGTRLVVKDLVDNRGYYFIVRTYTTTGIESLNSNEVFYKTPQIPPPVEDEEDTIPNEEEDDITCNLMVSASSDRLNSMLLGGRTVSGIMYVFTHSDTNISKVSFYLDDPGMNRSPIKIESAGPFDFAGTENNGKATAYNTTQLSEGSHEITARIILNNSNIKVLHSIFTVLNHLPQEDPINDEDPIPDPDTDPDIPDEEENSTNNLMISSSPDRSNSIPLEDKTVSGVIYVYTRSDMNISRVSFYLDDPGMILSPFKTERLTPFDFAGTKDNGQAAAYNTIRLSDGPHEITARIIFNNKSTEIWRATFTIANHPSQEEPEPDPTQLPATTTPPKDINEPVPAETPNVSVNNETTPVLLEDINTIPIVDEFTPYQDNVKSILLEDGQSLTVESTEGTIISKLTIKEKPATSSIPLDDLDFTYGLVDLTIENVDVNGSAIVTLYYPEDSSPEAYYKYGPTPDKPEDHWYEFMYDGETGAEIDQNIVTLHFVDGKRGDDNVSVIDNKIADTVGGAVFRSSQAIQPEEEAAATTTTTSGESNNSEGCFLRCLNLQ